MQPFLIRTILQPVCQRMGRLSEKKKDRLFLSGGALLLLQMYLRLTDALEYRYAIHFVSCCFCLGLMFLGGMGAEIRPVKFKKSISILWFSAAILRILSGLFHNAAYLSEGLLLLAVYPIGFLCWAMADRERIFRLLGQLCRIAIVLYTLLSWLLSPMGWSKYPGLFDNTNSAACTLAAATVGIVLELLYNRHDRRQLLWDFILLGLATALNYYTNSRSGFWGLFFALILAILRTLIDHLEFINRIPIIGPVNALLGFLVGIAAGYVLLAGPIWAVCRLVPEVLGDMELFTPETLAKSRVVSFVLNRMG